MWNYNIDRHKEKILDEKLSIINNICKKNSYYMSLAYHIATESNDPSTQVGAVIVGPDREIRSTGYNGIPRGCFEEPEKQESPEKYFWYEHAERNAIYNAARVGIPLNECVLFTQGVPCADCARAIIQSGIIAVIYDKKWNLEINSKWEESTKRSEEMLHEARILLIALEEENSNNPITKFNCLYTCKEFNRFIQTRHNGKLYP
jgi:dCMP deaminase